MKVRFESTQRTQGIAILIVLFVIVALAGLAGMFAYSMRVEMRLARNSNYDAQSEWLGRSGVELARYVLAQQARVPNQGGYEALNQKWAGGSGDTNSTLADISLESVPLGDGRFSVKITDYERKFNINVADPTILQQAMILMGIDATTSPTILDSIQDWIDRDDNPHTSGAESDYYLTLEPPYFAKNGLIDDLQELRLVKGISSEMYWGTGAEGISRTVRPSMMESHAKFAGDAPNYPVGLVDLFVPVSSGRLNINTASATALQLIPFVDANAAAAILQVRAGPDGVDGTDDDTPFRSVGELGTAGLSREAIQQISRYCDVRSHTFEVQIDTEINNYRKRYLALIRRNNGNVSDFQILWLSWK